MLIFMSTHRFEYNLGKNIWYIVVSVRSVLLPVPAATKARGGGGGGRHVDRHRFGVRGPVGGADGERRAAGGAGGARPGHLAASGALHRAASQGGAPPQGGGRCPRPRRTTTKPYTYSQS